jgi:hypothetical protein
LFEPVPANLPLPSGMNPRLARLIGTRALAAPMPTAGRENANVFSPCFYNAFKATDVF